LDLRDSRRFPIKTVFCYAQDPYKTGIHTYIYIFLCNVGGIILTEENDLLGEKPDLWHFVHYKSRKDRPKNEPFNGELWTETRHGLKG